MDTGFCGTVWQWRRQLGGRRPSVRRQESEASQRSVGCRLPLARWQRCQAAGRAMSARGGTLNSAVRRVEERRAESTIRRCRSCGRQLFGRGNVCRSRRCPEYGPVWAGDQRQKLFRNLETLPGDILLSAVTAPGAEVLPWDTQQCSALGEHRHSGKLGCRVRRASGREWNESAADRWRRLHRRAYQDAVKRAGKRSVFLVARVWEMQARGVLHVHPVLAYGTARQMAGARCYLARLAELAPQYGFGFVHHSPKHVKPQPAQNAAAYLSSYFVKGKRGKETLWESARSSAMPRSIVHVSIKLTQRTGCTMRTLRLKRAIFYVWRATLPFEEVRAVSTILQAFPGAELVAPGSPDRAPPKGA